MQNFAEYGFPFPDDLIMAFVGGSQLHGAKVEGKDDTDWYGVFIEPPQKALGLDGFPHYVFTTGGQPGGNQPEDVDVCLYSLRKAAGLMAKGNPSVLHFLFAKTEHATTVWQEFAVNPTPFLAQTHIKAFIGFADAQLKRLLNERSKDVNRPWLVGKFGYDTKYAMHIIRLYGEAKELMEQASISLPRPEVQELVAIRNGKYSLAQIRELAEEKKQEALRASEKSSLPKTVNRKEISRRLARAYQVHWAHRGCQI
jgi:predicted nucleotidyltransferase